jgi:hypothetical protein
MADRKGAVVSGVHDLISASFARQIEAGDSVRLWTCDAPPDDERPEPIRWDPEDIAFTSRKLSEEIRDVRFQRGTLLGPTMSELAALAPQTSVLLAVIYTDGEEPLSGISSAPEINRELPKLRREANRLKRPIQVALLARDGQWTDWRLTVGADPRFMCRLPARPKPRIVAETVAPAPVPEPQAPVEPLQEKPSIVNYPPGAKVVAAVTEPAPTASENPPAPDIVLEPEPTRSVAEEAAPAEPVLVAKTHEKPAAPKETVAEIPATVSTTAPPPPAAVVLPTPVPFKAESSPPPLVLLQTNVLPSIARVGSPEPASELRAPALKVPLAARLAASLAAGGGCCLFLLGIMLRRRTATRRSSFISQSLGR